MHQENDGQCIEKNKKLCKVKRAGESDRTPFIDRTENCLIFHTAIIINRKNWRITIKLHFENLSIFLKKRTYTHDWTPLSFLPLFVFVRISMTPNLQFSLAKRQVSEIMVLIF